MAVGRLSGQWICEILRANYPGGVVRRVLLDEFASLLVSKRSSAGAKGRLARRLYGRLDYLQRRGLIDQADGIIRPLEVARKVPRDESLPSLGPILQKKRFLALMAEDRHTEDENGLRLHATRWDFLASATEAGWSLPQAGSALGITTAEALKILKKVPAQKIQRRTP